MIQLGTVPNCIILVHKRTVSTALLCFLQKFDLLLGSFCNLYTEGLRMTRQEFDTFTVKVRNKLLALAWRYKASTGLADDPEDIVQEALITLWRLITEGYPVRDAEAISVKITKNLAAACTRRQMIDSVSVTDIDVEGGTSATELTDEQDRRTIRTELYKSLTPTQIHYLELRNELGLSLDDIARMTGKPKTSIKTTISAARKQLLEQIKKPI